MRAFRRYILAGLCMAGITAAYGQTAEANARKWKRYQDSVTDSKLGKPFLSETRFTCTDGRQIDFAQADKTTFACFGMNGCAPCRRELPALVNLAARHPELDFIYITHDDATKREAEFEAALGKAYQLPANFSQLQLPIDEMKRLHIYLGYPAKYILDRQGIVRYFRWGGESMNKTKEEVEQIYEAAINGLR